MLHVKDELGADDQPSAMNSQELAWTLGAMLSRPPSERRLGLHLGWASLRSARPKGAPACFSRFLDGPQRRARAVGGSRARCARPPATDRPGPALERDQAAAAMVVGARKCPKQRIAQAQDHGCKLSARNLPECQAPYPQGLAWLGPRLCRDRKSVV